MSALFDIATGDLWYAQRSAVSRLVPPPATAAAAPAILITAVEVAAEPQALSPLGETIVRPLQVDAYRNHLRIDYVALSFTPGEEVRYQYRLGAESAWTAPSAQRSVNFANLSAGTYRFAVRAVTMDGTTSAAPATLEFTVLPPIWRRWWFLSLIAAATAAVLYGAYRYRLAKAVEIATVRARIATDLHDDIGANLTKIAILSEVARQQSAREGNASEHLTAIARISRESVAAMRDVVWAVNPRRDTLRDTIRRMRQHAEESVAGRNVRLEFHTLAIDLNLRVPIDVRRDFFLIFKESLNNAVRHSQCKAITIEVSTDAAMLHLRVVDDGVGFDVRADPTGVGLDNMRRRAEKINAALEVASVVGQGTIVKLSVPASSATRLRRPA
jgi:signal transduction histidine kinase